MQRTMARRQKKQRWLPRFFPALVVLVVVLAAVKLVLLWTGSSAPAKNQTPPNPEWIAQELLPVNPYSRPGTALEKVSGIVIHYVGNPGTTAAQNRSYFAGLATTGETYASSHFLVDTDGGILQCVPLDEVAYCSNSRNEDTIAIEVCHPDATGAFTPEAEDALVELVRWLQAYYGLDTDQILRHYDITGKDCPRDWVQHPETWENFLAQLSQ